MRSNHPHNDDKENKEEDDDDDDYEEVDDEDEDEDEEEDDEEDSTYNSSDTPSYFSIPDWMDEFTPSVSTTTHKPHRITPSPSPSPSHRTSPPSTHPPSTASLSTLPYDTSSQILLYLPLRDILSFSLVSHNCRDRSYHNDRLWKIKFDQRWNCNPEDTGLPEFPHQVYEDVVVETTEDDRLVLDVGNDESGEEEEDDEHEERFEEMGDEEVLRNIPQPHLDTQNFWRQCYQNALTNPHDLWITHWNCTLPIDAVSPGRAVVPDVVLVPRPDAPSPLESKSETVREEEERLGYRDGIMERCPTCRYHPLLCRGGTTDDIVRALECENAFAKRMEAALDGGGGGGGTSPIANDADDDNDDDDDDKGEKTTTTTTKEEDTNILNTDPVSRTERIAAAHAALWTAAFPARRRLRSTAAASGETTTDQQAGDEEPATTITTTNHKEPVETTLAKTVFASTQFSLAKWGRHLRYWHNLDLELGYSERRKRKRNGCVVIPDDTTESSPLSTSMRNTVLERRRYTSLHAFRNSATYGRTIDPLQYRSSGLNFLRDVVFHPLRPTHERVELWEPGRRREIEVFPEEDMNEEEDAAGMEGHVGEGVGEPMTTTACPVKVPPKSSRRNEWDHALLDVYGRPFVPPPPPSSSSSNENDNAEIDADADPNNNPNTINDHTQPICDYPLYAHRPGTLSSLGPNHETALHSWHTLRLTNPDYVRPLAFRVYVQRPDCFTASPSSGYIRPGRTSFLTLGVRTLGSLMSCSYDDVDCGREETGTDGMSGEIYETEGTLPEDAFAVRYMYCPPLPCVPPELKSRLCFSAETMGDGNGNGGIGGGGANVVPPPGHHRAMGMGMAEIGDEAGGGRGQIGLIHHLWENISSEAEVRTIHLSAHVNGSYAFDEFQNHTMAPFDRHKTGAGNGNDTAAIDNDYYEEEEDGRTFTAPYRPAVFISPELQTKDPAMYAWLNADVVHAAAVGAGSGPIGSAVSLSYPSSPYGAIETERGCVSCGGDWDARREFLGRCFVLRKAICEEYARLRSRQMRRVVECLRTIPRVCWGECGGSGGSGDGEEDCGYKDDGGEDVDDDGEETLNDLPLDRIYQLLYYIHRILLVRRGDMSLMPRQRDALRAYEICENALSLEICEVLRRTNQTDRGGWGLLDGGVAVTAAPTRHCVSDIPWREAGVYLSSRCTDDHHRSSSISTPSSNVLLNVAKEEPSYLSSFRKRRPLRLYDLMWPDDDDDEDNDDRHRSTSSLTNDPRDTESFEGDALGGGAELGIALSMIHDPRTLLGRGIYDRVPEPGTVTRCHVMDYDAFRSFHSSTVTPASRRARFEALHRSALETVRAWEDAAPARKAGCSSTSAEGMCEGWKTAAAATAAAGTTGSRRRRPERRILPFSINDPDIEGLLIAFVQVPAIHRHCHVNSMVRYIKCVPPPGTGRHALSAVRRIPPPTAGANANANANSDGANTNANAGSSGGRTGSITTTQPPPSYTVVPLDLHSATHLARSSSSSTDRADEDERRQRQQQRQRQQLLPPPLPNFADRPPFLPMGHIGGLRLFNSLWIICEQLGWSVEDEVNPGQVMVDRKMMTSVQWLSNSLMIFPLLWSLFARWDLWISPYPLEYHYNGSPYAPTKQMRYLRSDECGFAAVFFLIMWLALGRYAERHICRTYDRSMADYYGVNFVEDDLQSASSSSDSTNETIGVGGRWKKNVFSFLIWCQRQWDYACPLSLQRLLYTPHWNRRSPERIRSQIISAKSNDGRENRYSFCANESRYKGDRILSGKQQLPGFMSRVVVCLLVGGGSFCASSPHYVLNLCTIFSCSISMGLSISLNYMEISRTPRSISVLSKFRHMRFEVFVTMFFLVGQLVGSSGGILFLAEFVVTTIGLVLGGAATISTNAFESWICFFCLSSTAFWGYLLARVSLANGVRQNKQGCPSVLLTLSFCVFSSLWITLTLCEWELPTTIMIVHPGWMPFYGGDERGLPPTAEERMIYYRDYLP